MISVLIYTIGDKAHGMGHVMRELVLARELRRRGVEITFFTPPNTPGWDRIQAAEFGISDVPIRTDAVIVDLEARAGYSLDMSLIYKLRMDYHRLIVVNGAGWRRNTDGVAELVDLQVCQSVLEDAPDEPNTLSGPQYIMVDPRYAECVPDKNGPIAVAMGGLDTHGLNSYVCSQLNGGIRVADNRSSLLEVLNGASICVCALGMTTYEALAAGVPCIVTNWSADHERTAAELERRGCVINIGLWTTFEEWDLFGLVRKVGRDWEQMSRAGRELVDGRGVARAADRI